MTGGLTTLKSNKCRRRKNFWVEGGLIPPWKEKLTPPPLWKGNCTPLSDFWPCSPVLLFLSGHNFVTWGLHASPDCKHCDWLAQLILRKIRAQQMPGHKKSFKSLPRDFQRKASQESHQRRSVSMADLRTDEVDCKKLANHYFGKSLTLSRKTRRFWHWSVEIEVLIGFNVSD